MAERHGEGPSVTSSECHTFCADMLRHCTAQGVEAQVELSLTQGRVYELSQQQHLETSTLQNDAHVSITLYADGRVATGSCNVMDISRARHVADQALSKLPWMESDAAMRLPDAQACVSEVPPIPMCEPWALDAEEAVRLGRSMAGAALAYPGVDRLASCDVRTTVHQHCLHQSGGFEGYEERSQHSYHCTVLATDAQGAHRDGDGTVACRRGACRAPEAVGHEAGRRAAMRCNPRSLRTQRCAVLFAPDVARSLVRHWVGAVSGPRLYQDASFLADGLGQACFPTFLHLEEEPWMPWGLGSSAYDQDGVATRPARLVDAGVLQQFCLSHYVAQRLGLAPTGHGGGVHNLLVRDTAHSMDQVAMMNAMGTGLWVTELSGQGVDLATGDYSRGAFGYWVEQGEVKYPVQDVALGGSLPQMFKSLVAVGQDVDPEAVIQTGSWWVDGMTVGGGA